MVGWLADWLVGWLLCWLVGLCWFVMYLLTRVFYEGVVVKGLLRAVGCRLEKLFQMHVVNQSLSKILHCRIVDKL